MLLYKTKQLDTIVIFNVDNFLTCLTKAEVRPYTMGDGLHLEIVNNWMDDN